jgi:pSer/pThr/pTyr-binding forkhead associated (FHA) protein
MPKMIVSLDGIVVKDVVLTKNRTTLGRRPYNDIVIDNLAVSGEHAVIQMSSGQVYIEDLNSTNGTNLNGKTIKREMLRNNDTIDIGKYKIKYFQDAEGDDFERTQVFRPGATPVPAVATPSSYAPIAPTTPAGLPEAAPLPNFEGDAAIRVISGAAIGRQVPLVKVVTTIGKIGVSVASITKRRHGFVVAHVEGTSRLLLNGTPIGADPVPLRDKDVLELASTQMQFLHL